MSSRETTQNNYNFADKVQQAHSASLRAIMPESALLQRNMSQDPITSRDEVGDQSLRISQLTKETKLLSKRSSKDEKLLRMQKKMFDKHTQKLNLQI